MTPSYDSSMNTAPENARTTHLVSSIVFFILVLNVVGLIYLLANAPKLWARVAAVRIEKALDAHEARQKTSEKKDAPAELPGNSAAAPTPASQALTMAASAPISATGACVSIENFKSETQARSAKALLASSTLRDKSWTVSTPMPAMYLAGIQTESAAGSRKISKSLSDMGLSPLSVSANFVGLAKADTAAAASELATVSAANIQGARIVARQISQATERHAIVALPQSRLEAQFAASLTTRLQGTTLSAVPCPEVAAPLLASPTLAQ